MKTIKILGTGCAKCEKLAGNVKQAAENLGLDYEMEKVTDLNQIMSFWCDDDTRSGRRRSSSANRQGSGCG